MESRLETLVNVKLWAGRWRPVRIAAYSASATWFRPIRRAICFTFIFCS